MDSMREPGGWTRSPSVEIPCPNVPIKARESIPQDREMDGLVKRGHESLLNRRDGSSVRADVKQYVLSRYQMEKLSKDGWGSTR